MRDFAAELARRTQDGLYRTRRIIESPQGTELTLGERRVLSFCSNDYLGLANHPAVINALRKGAERWGVGSGAAHLVSGHSRAHHDLEEELADFCGRERALLFSTGYMANVGVISALTDKHDTIFEDKLNHASLIDGAQFSDAALKRFPHADMQRLAAQLNDVKPNQAMIASDGVFSMDGDIAPLTELVSLSEKHQAMLMIDDAHGFGVLGEHGGGCAEHFKLDQNQLPVLVGTLGKAFGTFGAFVAGSEALIEYLIQSARSFIYTTALPPAIAEATRVSLKLLQQENWRREQLQTLIKRFRDSAQQLGLQLMPSITPIQPIVIGEAQAAVNISEHLLAQNILVPAIRPPTVPKGSARLRITFSATHTEQQVDRLLDALEHAA